MQRRHVLATATTLLASTTVAGCLTDDSTGTDATTTHGDPTTDASTSGTTEDYVGTEEASNTPAADHQITARNDHDEPHELGVLVARTEDGERAETVHESTRELAPGSVESVYNLQDATPDGVQSFAVESSVGDQVEVVVLETSMCYGDLEIVVDETGELDPIYAIC